ncbi:MAG: hypothetical protein ABL908_19885, partial [Hyphomicrobium sp.]
AERKATILYVAAEVVRQLAILVQPAMPRSGVKLLGLLAQGIDDPSTFEEARPRMFVSLGPAGRLRPGLQLPEPEGVFPRYVDPAAEAQKTTGQSAEQQKAAKAAKEAKRAAEREKAKDRDKDKGTA